MNFLNNDVGGIHLIIGPMFSNKTSILKDYLTKAKYSKLDYILITPKSFSKLADVSPNGVKIIGIDDGHYFLDLLEYADLWANAGYKIYIAARDGNFMREPFEQICNLVPKSEIVEKHYSICQKCFKNEASFSKGIPVCRLCYLELASL